MNKNNNYPVKKINSFISDIPINEESRDNLFSLATSHDLAGLEDFITTNSISLNVKNNNNQTIIHVLLETNTTIDELELLRCIKFLIDRGANISSSDKFLLTPLFICIKKKYFKIFKYLLEKGASLDITTYNNQTVLHILSQPEYVTYDENGIKNLIPEKLPKFDIEKFNEIKTDINNVFNKNNDVEEGLQKFKDIATQFYYNDDTEDFNNVLLIDNYKKKNESELKDDLFEKLQEQLKDFYNEDNTEITVNNLEEELNNKLNKNILDLNSNIISMKGYNDNILTSIKNLALSLELIIHFFFLEEPTYIYIPSDIAIGIADSALINIPQDIIPQLNINNMRPTVNAVLYLSTLKNNQELIELIKTRTSYNSGLVLNNGLPNIVAGFINGIAAPVGLTPPQTATFAAIKAAAANVANPVPANPPQLIASVVAALAQAPAAGAPPQLASVPNHGVPLGAVTIKSNIQNAANTAATVVKEVATLETYIREAITVIPTANRSQVLAVLQSASRASIYAAVYVQNKSLLLPIKVSNISAVHAAIDAGVVSGVIDGAAAAAAGVAAGAPVVNQEILQIELINEVVSLEATVIATSEAVLAAARVVGTATNSTDIDNVIAAVKEALENIDVNKESIETIIAIANKVKEQTTVIATQLSNIVRVLINTDVVREAELAVNTAVKTEGTNKKIVVEIRKLAVDVASQTGTFAVTGDVNKAIIIENLIIEEIEKTIISTIVTKVKEALTALAASPGQLITVVATALAINLGAGAPVPLVQVQGGPGVPTNPNVKTNIEHAANTAASVVNEVATVETYIREAIKVVPIADILKVLVVLQATSRASAYAAVYVKNKLLVLPIKVANISAVHAAIDAGIVSGVLTGALANISVTALKINDEELQKELQNVLKDQVVATESILNSASIAVEEACRVVALNDQQYNTDSQAVLDNVGGVGLAAAIDLTYNNLVIANKQIILDALKEALRLPPIIPKYFKNQDYNELIKSYNLMNIPQQYINYNNNISYKYDDNFIEVNIKSAKDTIKHKLPKDNRSYAIDYFNLLYTFNEYVKNNYNQQANIDKIDIFILYKNIQQIYKYNYIINIFEKEKEKILSLRNNYTTTINIGLKKDINQFFDDNYNELEKNVKLISTTLQSIEISANEYIDIYNKINGLKIFENLDNNTKIGIYPKIKFPTEIKYSFGDENAIIAKCNDYITYNDNKNDFFHNFILYFQDIGIYNTAGTLLNEKKNNYNNIIITSYSTDEKNKAYKLYFYDSIYLRLEKQKIIEKLLKNDVILKIKIQKYEGFNDNLLTKFNNKLKTEYLHKILNEEFNKILVFEINNFLKNQLLNDELKKPITYNSEIIEPNIKKLLLNSLGFKHILIPNYEFTNNSFLSISNNNFLELILYFDTKYFEDTTLKPLKYYKENIFILEILKNNTSLIFKKDIKGWSPIYYAIDGNNRRVIQQILKNEKNTLKHYDNKEISPLQLCINKQLHHLNYLLDDDNDIHYLNNYIKMLKNELKNNEILIPLNIEAVFIIALFIQNHIWNDNDKIDDKLNDFNNLINTRKKNIKKIKINKDYDESTDSNKIFKKYNLKAKELETKDFGSYGSYWKNWKNLRLTKKIKFSILFEILVHIDKSIELKKLLIDLKQLENKNNKFNIPEYKKDTIQKKINELVKIKNKLKHYLKFINIRFNTNEKNTYNIFLQKIYVHTLANIIGLDFYLRIEELIINHYINSNVNLDNQNTDNIKQQLLILNKFLINNKLDKTNINYLYITDPIPESVLKNKIKEILLQIYLPGEIEVINIFETVVLPKYRDLYKITYKYLKMFILNYHKFIYNQYHGLNILLLLLNNVS
jgi:hypothetical protein